VFAAAQIRRSRLTSAATFLLQLDASFKELKSEAISIQEIAKKIDVGTFQIDENSCSEILPNCSRLLDFFETLGLLVTDKLITVEFAWTSFGYWVMRYWIALENCIKYMRRKYGDETYYREFQILSQKIFSYESKQTGKSVEQIKSNIRDELMRRRGSSNQRMFLFYLLR
jgi:ppGpp synthetase/RelA/SpoT-type nucleotidyltranferase